MKGSRQDGRLSAAADEDVRLAEFGVWDMEFGSSGFLLSPVSCHLALGSWLLPPPLVHLDLAGADAAAVEVELHIRVIREQ